MSVLRKVTRQVLIYLTALSPAIITFYRTFDFTIKRSKGEIKEPYLFSL